MNDFVEVYRFVCELGEARIEPNYVRGTLEAIEKLGRCTPILESATRCDRARLEDGLLFVL